MEPDIKEYFKRIAISISYLVIWLIINTFFGLKYNWAFFENEPSTGNYIFYGWLFISFILLILLIKKVWNQPVFDENKLKEMK